MVEQQESTLLVLTYPLSEAERALFNKILSSVSLGDYQHLELENITLAEFPQDMSATRVLCFANYPTGAHKFEDSTWTVLPPVGSMIGSGAEVVARKKETWNLLQQFVRGPL